VRHGRAFASPERALSVQPCAGHIHRYSDGFRGHRGHRAHGGQESHQGGVRREPSSRQDREESHLQGHLSVPLHVHLFSPNLLLSDWNLNCEFELQVKDVMRNQDDLPICRESDLIMDQLVELMSKGCKCLLVIDDRYRLIGTFTDSDLRRTL